MNGLVSVITPFLNAEKFLKESIESVLHQKYSSWELLLIDDGSEDSSVFIAQEYAQRDPERIRMLQHENHRNLGECASRNLGMRHASGEYIAFLDADDVWMPDYLEHQINILQRFPKSGMVYAPALYWHSWTDRNSDRKRDLIQDLGIETNRLYGPQELLYRIDPLGSASSACTCCIVIRKDLLERVGYFDERFRICGDQAFCMKVFHKENVFVSDACLAKYRRHADSVMSNARASKQYAEQRLLFLRWVELFLNENGLSQTKALKKAMWPYRYTHLQKLKTLFSIPFELLKRLIFTLVGPSAYHRLRRKLKG